MDRSLKIRLFRDILRIRLVEERIADLYPDQEMRCPVHLSIGQEAVAVGVCAALRQEDLALSGHRSHAHYLAKGGSLKRMLAELYGRVDGCSKGKGGSMHLTDSEAGFLAATPIVGSTIPIAVGAALTAKMRGEDRIVVAFFGDGATETGVFHEALNFASVKRLPVLFVCENNLYSVYSPLSVRQPEGRNNSQLISGHGIRYEKNDGNDLEVVAEVSRQAVAYVRSTGPIVVEFSTYRWREHCGPNYDNHLGYRTIDEFESWRQRDPVLSYELRLVEEGTIAQEEIRNLSSSIAQEIDEAVDFAKASPFPEPESLKTEVYA